MKHLREHTGVIHCESGGGDDYTLCGMALEGERGDTPMTYTHEGIDCDQCIGIIRFCKKVRDGEIKSPAERRAKS